MPRSITVLLQFAPFQTGHDGCTSVLPLESVPVKIRPQMEALSVALRTVPHIRAPQVRFLPPPPRFKKEDQKWKVMNMHEDQAREPAFDAVIPVPVRHCVQLSANAKLLYGEIRALAGPRGYCWASNKYLGDLYSLTERSVARIIAQLGELNFVTIQILRDKQGHVSGRRIYIGCGFPELENDTLPHMTKKSGHMTKMSDQHDKNVSQDINKNNITKKGDVRAPACEKEPKDAPARAELKKWAYDRFGAEADSDLVPVLMAFCDARLAKKKPLPAGRAVTALTNKLMRFSMFGNLQIMLEMLDKAILHGWESVYQLKEDELAEILGKDSSSGGGYEKCL